MIQGKQILCHVRISENKRFSHRTIFEKAHIGVDEYRWRWLRFLKTRLTVYLCYVLSAKYIYFLKGQQLNIAGHLMICNRKHVIAWSLGRLKQSFLFFLFYELNLIFFLAPQHAVKATHLVVIMKIAQVRTKIC